MNGFGAAGQTLPSVGENGARLAFPTSLEVGLRSAAEARKARPIFADLVLPAGLLGVRGADEGRGLTCLGWRPYSP